MTKPNKKQLLQANNIIDTILEAADHFFQLIKKKELTQSIYIYSSIVEGYNAISVIISTLNPDKQIQYNDKIEKHLLLITEQLEKGNLVKVAEIMQFSFIPNLNRVKQIIVASAEIPDVGNKTITIGVYASQRNPRAFYTTDRVNAMVAESEKQHTKLFFFTDGDVNFEYKEIEADVWKNGKWERLNTPFPDVINNVGAGRKSHTQRKLQRQIPFTSFHVGNKFTLPQRMAKYRKYTDLLVPFRVCNNEDIIYNFLKKNNRVVFKALRGNRGENIYFITKKGNRYVLLDQKKERILNQQAFHEWLQNTIMRLKGSYIIQRYIHTRTKDDEPYHIRAHMQKDGDGEWVLTHIYPRVGNKKSNLSNISTEGRVEELNKFLMNQYGEQGNMHEENIMKLSMDLAWHLDKLYEFALDELGIDLAIDETGRYWMHETNNGPQTAFHEEKRAVNTIAYAKYIAINGVVKSNQSQKVGLSPNQFQARTTTHPYAKLDKRTSIGHLVEKAGNEEIALAGAETANSENVHFFRFTPADIDFDEMLIKGYFYENEEWVPKVVEYPDVIMDQIKMRGLKQTQILYEELEGIPFTNEWNPNDNKRSTLYQQFQSDEKIQEVLSPFQEVTKVRHIFQFLERYGKVVLKAELGPINANRLTIEVSPNGSYTLTTNKSVKEYKELSLRNYLKNFMKNRQLLVQKHDSMQTKDEEDFYIHLHMVKDGNDEWHNAALYVHIAKDKNNTSIADSQLGLEDFLRDNDIQAKTGHIKGDIAAIAKNIIATLDNDYEGKVSELAMTLTIDSNQDLRIMDINPNGPESIYDIPTYAACIVTNAISLVEIEIEKELDY